MTYTDIMINDKTIRLSGEINDEIKKYITAYNKSSFIFDIKDFAEYISRKRNVIGYVGGKETRKKNPYDYIIYL